MLGHYIFPYNIRSVAAAWQRACVDLNINDLRFHDLRHEGISRLFEAGLSIQEVAMVSGHRSWNNLKRYTQLRPESLHDRFGAPITAKEPLPEANGEDHGSYLGEWSSQADILNTYGLRPKDVAGVEIVFAAAFEEASRFVLFREDGRLFEVACGADWLPEATTANSIRHRVKTGKIGRSGRMDLFAAELLEVLDTV